jgi:hypothetical protein
MTIATKLNRAMTEAFISTLDELSLSEGEKQRAMDIFLDKLEEIFEREGTK